MRAHRAGLVAARVSVGLTQEELAHRIGVDRSTIGRWESGTSTPQPWARRKLAAEFGLTVGALGDLLTNRILASTATSIVPVGGSPVELDDEIAALELMQRAAASDVGAATLVLLERGVDDLASSYATTAPDELLPRVRQHLTYVGQLIGGRTTLSEHRSLLIAAGWLSLLAATLHVDLRQDGAAAVRLRAADGLAAEAEHAEIRAWVLETQAWSVLTNGDYAAAAELSRGAQLRAPAGSSARLQAYAQEGRALARLGDTAATVRAVGQVNRLADPLPVPDRPEHHYRYDPAKAISYTATTLAWAGDPAAVDYAREVIGSQSAGAGRTPRRLAVARLDLALALVRTGEVDEAATSALDAMTSGHVAASNWWRAREVVHGMQAAGTRLAMPLSEAYRELERGSSEAGR